MTAAEAAAEFLTAQLKTVRAVFYKTRGDKEWWQDQRLLKQMLTEPARYLHERGTALSPERQTAILREIFRTIALHGDLATVRRMAPYLLHAVQEHLRHHGEDYYAEAKAARQAGDVAGKIVGRLKTAPKGAAGADSLGVTAKLVDLRTLTATRVRGRRRPAAPEQGTLL